MPLMSCWTKYSMRPTPLGRACTPPTPAAQLQFCVLSRGAPAGQRRAAPPVAFAQHLVYCCSHGPDARNRAAPRSAPSPCSRRWRRGSCWRRGGRSRSAAGALAEQSRHRRGRRAAGAAACSDRGGRRRALCRGPRRRPVPLARPAAVGRARCSAFSILDLVIYAQHVVVPPRAVAVAAAPHAPRRPRHRRQHRACASIRSKS